MSEHPLVLHPVAPAALAFAVATGALTVAVTAGLPTTLVVLVWVLLGVCAGYSISGSP